MLYRSHVPRGPLAAHVERLWLLCDAPAHARERVMPSGTFELVFNLAEDEIRIHDGAHVRRHSGAVVSGAFSRFFEVETRAHASIVGVHLKPGGAAALLGVAAREHADAHVDLETLWGKAARALRAELCDAPIDVRLRRLEARLGERVAEHAARARRHPAVPFAIAQLDAGAAVSALAGRVDLSHRRFIEVFRASVGLTPKLYARVRRFERAIASARHVPDGSRLAADHGYFDQSHMIRDFVAFSGFTPRELVRRSSSELKVGHVLA
jgi:AraC-like DNA-binding protein